MSHIDKRICWQSQTQRTMISFTCNRVFWISCSQLKRILSLSSRNLARKTTTWRNIGLIESYLWIPLSFSSKVFRSDATSSIRARRAFSICSSFSHAWFKSRFFSAKLKSSEGIFDSHRSFPTSFPCPLVYSRRDSFPRDVVPPVDGTRLCTRDVQYRLYVFVSSTCDFALVRQ